MEEKIGKAIGIDFGTTYCRVAVWQNYGVNIINNEHGSILTPSYVGFVEMGGCVGNDAKNQENMSPSLTVFDFKRLIGRRFFDPLVQAEMKHLPFIVVPGYKGKPWIDINTGQFQGQFTPEEIAGLMLCKMKKTAEIYLGHAVTDAVITVPASFNDRQRKAMKEAANIAGLNVMRTINESSAAALAYGMREGLKSGTQHILVFRLGGGTFDVSVSVIQDGICRVLATAGDAHFGGNDFDERIQNYCAGEILRTFNKDITTNKLHMRKLRMDCERAKRILSYSGHTTLEISLNYPAIITREMFEEWCEDLFCKSIETVRIVLKDAGIAKAEVKNVFLVGGSTRIPKFQQLLNLFFDGRQLCQTMNIEEAAVSGAAILAGIMSDEKMKSLGSYILHDITPFSLGLELLGGAMSTFIPRNSPMPSQKIRFFARGTKLEYNTCVRVFEGESPIAEHNHLLGNLDLSEIFNAIEATPIRLVFEIDEAGTVTVSAQKLITRSWSTVAVMNPINDYARCEFEADDQKDERRTGDGDGDGGIGGSSTNAGGLVADKGYSELWCFSMEPVDEGRLIL